MLVSRHPLVSASELLSSSILNRLRLFLIFTALLCLFSLSAQVSRAATVSVPAGGSLQAAINAAQPGDTILLEAGATYMGPFTLPVKAGAEYITIRTAVGDANLPADKRVTPAQASLMPKIVTPGSGQPALKTEAGAHHYRFIGIEFMPATASAFVYDLITFGVDRGGQTSLSQVPHHLILDRCYIHGQPGAYLKRGVALNSAHTEVINSHVSDCKAKGQDSQALMGWNGPGPFKIINNYLEGAGENLMFGGADPGIPNLVPSDIEVRRNHFSKPLSWRGVWTVKNLFELKNAQRVVVDGNLFEYSWADAQTGYAILFTPRNQEGSAPWSVVQDVAFTNNIVRHSASAVQVLGKDYIQPSQQTARITIQNNLFEDISGSKWGGAGHFLQLTDGAADITFDHNTIFHVGNIMAADANTNINFRMTNNIMQHNAYGVHVDSGAYNAAFPAWVFTGNVIIGGAGNASKYPLGNYYPAQQADVGYVNLSGGDYRLAATSQFKSRGTDGKDIGCDFSALSNAMASSSATVSPTPTPTPVPTPIPTPVPTPVPTPSATPVPTPVPNTNAPMLRINTGGGRYTDPNGNVWQDDSFFLSGKVYAPSSLSTADILSTSNNALYRDERYSDGVGIPLDYSIPVANGSYTVKLHFAEIWYGVANSSGAGARVFNVSLETKPVLSNYDIYARAGGALKAQVEEFQTTVTDGVLNIRLTSVVDNANISGIEVIANTAATPTPTPTPTSGGGAGSPAILMANGGGAVFNAASMKMGPFDVETQENLGTDKRTRLMIFANGVSSSVNTSHASGYINVNSTTIANVADLIKVEARASDGRIFQLPVEYAGAQGAITGLDQIHVVLVPELRGIGNIELTLIVGSFRTNSATVIVR
jgi:hypothetical protein